MNTPKDYQQLPSGMHYMRMTKPVATIFAMSAISSIGIYMIGIIVVIDWIVEAIF